MNPLRQRVVIGLFDDVEKAANAARALFSLPLPEGHVTTISSVPLPDGAVVSDPKPILFPWIVAGFWILGAVAGIALALVTYRHYPLVTAGKPILTIPPTIIVAYELAMLAGILTTLASGFGAIGLPRFGKKKVYDPRIHDGKIAVCARVGNDEQAHRAIEAMQTAGGTDVREEEGEL